jgi:type I restriction enzyme R subunit
MSDTELSFRSFDDYVSKYRKVIDWFAAVKIGLTATPALHTTEIFGPPVFTYSYREAVIDGYLVDHDPPIRIKTELSANGIAWQKGAEVPVYNPQATEIELFKTPDELKFDVEDFNRKVITESFNRVVCEYLAREIDPASPTKTLVFCANDAHADLVVTLLKQAFQEAYGSVDDDAVIKITGTADKPLQLIRRYKNEHNPVIAVTVDLLTTGIDVPAICNLVFLRRINSRILFDQMLGRATRPCEEIGKETFRIFDAVRLYEALQAVTAMTPVVVDPSIPFSRLEREFAEAPTEEATALVRDQFLAKLQRKKRHLSETTERDFETVAGMSPGDFARHLRDLPLESVATWFSEHPGLGEILDRKSVGTSPPIFISDHEDRFQEAEYGYGSAKKPEDFLHEFEAFIKAKTNELPALKAVVTRPRDLTRQQLKELLLELDKAGYSEATLTAAWRQATNRDIAARIIGYIRQAALGDPLVPFEQRVDHALQSILASRSWTTPQREWLKKLAAQTRANLLVDRAAIDDPNLLFKREGGGFTRLNKIFGGELESLLHRFNDAVWESAG